MVRIHLEWHGHEVRTELRNSPDDGETFQLSGGVGLLSLVERPRCTADDAFFAFLDLRQYCPRPAVDVSVYKRNGWLKSGKAVIGLVVRSALRRSKASWQSALQ